MLARDDVTMAHIQRGAKHQTVTQYWANVSTSIEGRHNYDIIIVDFGLVDMTISTKQKPTIYRKLHENLGTNL